MTDGGGYFSTDFSVSPELEHVTRKKVVIAIPTRGNDMYWGTVLYLIQQYRIMKDLSLSFGLSGWKASHEGIFKTFRDGTFDYLHLLDSDVAPHHDTLLRLLSHEQDFVTAPVYMFAPAQREVHLNVHTNGIRQRLHHRKPGGLEEINSTSFCCCVISRRFLDVFKEADESPTEWSDLLAPTFKEQATDAIFCAKARALGLKLYCDWGCADNVHHRHVALSHYAMETFALHRHRERQERINAAAGNDG